LCRRRQSLAGVLLARPRPVGNTAAMSERDDYADNDLPPPKRLTPQVALIIVILLTFAILVGLPLLAGIVASRMKWE